MAILSVCGGCKWGNHCRGSATQKAPKNIHDGYVCICGCGTPDWVQDLEADEISKQREFKRQFGTLHGPNDRK